MSWVHVGDVVESIRYAAGHDSIDGPFNVVAPEPVRMKQLARAIGEVLRRPSVMRVPAWVLKAMLGSGADALLTGQRLSPARLLQAGYRFRFERLQEALVDLLGRPLPR